MTPARRVLAEKRHLLYPLIGALLLNLALFAAVVYPLSQTVANGERDAAAAASARRTARAEYDAVRATVTGKATADAELKKFYGDVLPPDKSAARRLVYGKIDALATPLNVKPVTESVDDQQPKGSDLGKLTATVGLVGDYRNIRRLIYQLETAPDFVILENVALSQGQERQQGLNVIVKISTYFRAGDGN